jgi:hypothetical protein
MGKRIVISMRMTIELEDDTPAPNANIAHCPRCGWTRPYDEPKQAARGLRAHTALCKGQPTPDVIDVHNPPLAPIMQFWNEVLKQG